MNPLPIESSWWPLIWVLTLEILGIVGLTLILGSIAKSPRWSHALWQASFIAMGVVAIAAFTGLGPQVNAWWKTGARLDGDRALPSRESGFMPDFTKTTAPPAPVAENATIRSEASTTQTPSEAESLAPNHLEANPPVETTTRRQMPTQILIDVTDSPLTLQLQESSAHGAARPVNSDWWLGALWILGVVFALARVGMARLLLMVYRRFRKPVKDVGLLLRVQYLAHQLGLKKPVLLVESPWLGSPIAFGPLRPTIGLPAGFVEKFSVAQQQSMLAHELAHLQAGDPAWHLLADTVTAVFWWHPLTWYARRELHTAGEQAADEASLLVSDGPVILAECLVDLGRRPPQPRSLAWIGVEGQGFRSGLGRRVERLLALRGQSWRPPQRSRYGLVKATVSLALALVVAICSAWAAPQASTQGNPMNIMRQTWKQSLAVVTVAMALGTDANTPASAAQESANAPTVSNVTPSPAVQLEDSQDNQDRTGLANPAPSGGPTSSDTTPSNPPPAKARPVAPAGMSREMLMRYGLGGRQAQVVESRANAVQVQTSPSQPAAMPISALTRKAIQRKLETITFETITLPDAVPLAEIIKIVNREIPKSDPSGINWVMSNTPDPGNPVTTAIDPTTGLPADPISNIADVSIRGGFVLRQVKLGNVLDVILKLAEQPIKYTVENYGVVFSLGAPASGAAAQTEPITARYGGMSPELMKRYGLTPPEPQSSPATIPALQTRLDKMVFPKFKCPSDLPFLEAVKLLDTAVRANDPEKRGLNFIVSRMATDASVETTVDPVTGLPAVKTPNIEAASVRGGIELRQVTLRDILDVLVKTVDRPIKYTCEEYGVVFAPASLPGIKTPPRVASAGEREKTVASVETRLSARAFRLDSDSFPKRLQSTFGIITGSGKDIIADPTSNTPPKKTDTEPNRLSADIKEAIIKLGAHLGVKFQNPAKEVFYNAELGMLMLRGTAEDLDTMSAALETLNGTGATQPFLR